MIDISNIFLNDAYRKLILNGRTYASFTTEELDLIFNDLNNIENTVLDPMSGYGGLMQYCNKKNISTFNLELNLPAYYWQVLTNPDNKNSFDTAIKNLKGLNKNKYPTIRSKAKASDNWFTVEGLNLSKRLFNLINETFENAGIMNKDYSIALILPFIKRLSTCISGDVTHIKKGGITVFEGWQYDFELYLNALIENRLDKIPQNDSRHISRIGNVRDYKFKTKFNLVITSPPYPNYRDYYKMFAPENYFLENININTNPQLIIGSNVVKNKNKGEISSEVAKTFLKELASYNGNKKAKSDIKSYYIPYFHNYFADLESTCFNIYSHLESEATCYFSVVNNATRNLVVPVAQVIEELFVKKGFKSEYLLSEEVFHVGTKNPNARGLKAKHNKYIVKLCRK